MGDSLHWRDATRRYRSENSRVQEGTTLPPHLKTDRDTQQRAREDILEDSRVCAALEDTRAQKSEGPWD